MTQEEFYNALTTTGCPVTYLKFTEPQKLPFIAYALQSDDDFMADNGHYFDIESGWVELYAAKPDFVLQKEIEEILSQNRIPYRRTNASYIADEKMFVTVWDISLF